MEQEQKQQECACQEQEQPKKKEGRLGKVAKATALVAAGAVVTHEVMTRGGWTKSIAKGVKSLINRNKKDAVTIVEEDIYIPRETRNERRDFGRSDRQFNNKH